MLGAEGEENGVVVGRRLEFEVECGTELLAQRQAECLVDAAAEGGMDDHLHPAGLVEEALEDDVVAGGQDTELTQAGGHVVDQLPGVGGIEAAGLDHVCGRRLATGVGSDGAMGNDGVGRCTVGGDVVGPDGEEVGHGLAQVGDLLGELLGAARGLAHPEGDGGLSSLGVGDPDLALGHPADPPRMGPQEKDVAHHRLDGEVFVDRPHRGVVRIEDDPVVAHFGDGPPGGECGQAGPAPRPEDGVDPVAMEIGHPLAPAGGDALGGQFEDVLEVGVGQLGVGGGPTDESEHVGLGPLFGRRHLGHDLLGQDVEGGHRRMGGVEAAGADRGQESGALDQFVTGQGEEDPLGRPPAVVVGPTHSLQQGGDGPGRSHLADELDRSYVDTEFQ